MKNFLKLKNKRLILAKIFIIALPTYAVAFLTQKILYVVPTIAMMMMVANSIESGNMSNRNRIDEDGSREVDSDSDGSGDSSDGISEGDGGV
tara:strand:+ start:2133 stop:2408 length:276 start_codon:yes stop_codon:yes gene_type:complete